MEKRFVVLLLSIFLCCHTKGVENAFAQVNIAAHSTEKQYPSLLVKSNLLYDMTTTFHLGLEIRLNNYLSLELPFNYNPWTFANNRKIKHLLIQPELRYWVYEPFNGHFLGLHLHYSVFNIGGFTIPLKQFPELKGYRYEGDIYGLGFSYGYHWILSPRWGLEATLGYGYSYIDFAMYRCEKCGDKTMEGNKHYLGATKAGISIIYSIY